jgi:hypothetical protein
VARPARICALLKAATFVGTTEQPPGSNRGPLIDRWNMGAGVPLGSAWCMSFQHAMFRLCGVKLGGWASVGNFEAWAFKHAYEVRRPRRGDLICFEWELDSWPDHVGIAERVLALRWKGVRFVGWVRYIAGNDGNAVSRRTRWMTERDRFCRVP